MTADSKLQTILKLTRWLSSHEARLATSIIALGGADVKTLAQLNPMSQYGLSHSLEFMVSLGLLKRNGDGVYRLRDEPLDVLIERARKEFFARRQQPA